MTDAAKNVATVSASQQKMIDDAKLPRTLMGGTKAMRKAREDYLPRENAETQMAYDNRVRRSTLFNGFAKTVEDMTGKVFAKEIALSDDVPQQIKDFSEDIDLTGRHLNMFARDVLYDGLQVGGGYILTDAPPPPARADAQPPTLADYQATKWRPYLVYIKVENLIGWRSDRVNGAEMLTQVRILECVSEPDGVWLEKEIEQIRVIEPGTWQTYRKATAPGADKDEWILNAEGTNSLQKITLTPFYTNRTGFMTFCSPLEKLADTNLAHWQSQSDQRNILHVARVPILFMAGWKEGDTVEIGASSACRSSDANAKMTYVEHTGAAIGAGDKDLANLERQMEAMGLQLLVDKPGGQSATGEIRDDTKENSPLAMMARSLEDAIEHAFGFMAEYLNLGTDKGGEVEVNKDFGVSSMRGDLQQLIAARAAGDISQETLWDEMMRRDYLGPTFNKDVEKDRLANEAPALDGPNLLADPNALPKPPVPAPGVVA